ncbi:MAG: hypothetical protein FWB97_06655 [Oscillospiraceae bacterium]|nr:hypothetical protein [Oscillospiraceae bacterium]
MGRNEYTAQQKRDYALVLGIDLVAFARQNKQMLNIPSFSVPNFLHILLLMNFCLNNETLHLDDIAAITQTTGDSMPSEILDIRLKPPEESPIHSHMPFERRMLAFVRMGDAEGLKQLFKTYTHGTTGILAGNRLRHLQNISSDY